MNVYVFIYFIVSILLLNNKQTKKGYNISFFGYFLILLFMSLRYGYGNDFFNYQELFNYYNWSFNYDFDFEYLYKLLNYISFDFQIIIIIQSVLFLFSFYILSRALKKNYCNTSIVGALVFFNPYLFLIHLSALRQSLAISVFVIFIALYLINKRFFCLIIACFIPALFHKAALIYTAIPFISMFMVHIFYFKPRNKFIMIFSVSTFFLLILKYVMVGIFSKYAYYFELGYSQNISVSLLIYIFMLSLVIYNAKPIGINTFAYDYVYALSFVGLICMIISLFIPMFSRITLFFDFFIPFLIASSRFSINKYIVILLFVVFYILRNVSFINNDMWFSGFGYYKVFFL